MNLKIVLQDGIKDCGISCLLSIIRYYGGDASKEYLRSITNTTKDGTNFYYLIEAFKKFGFNAFGMTGEFENIECNNLPILAHIKANKTYNHFVVIYDINYDTNKITLMDPAKGKKVIPISEFKMLSTNNYIFIKKLKNIPKYQTKKIFKNRLSKFFKNNRKIYLILGITTLIYFLFSLLSSFHFKYLLIYSINSKVEENIFSISIVLLMLYIFKNITLFYKNILFYKIIIKLDIDTTNIFYKQILLLPYLFYKNRTTGEIVSRFKDLSIIKGFISNLFLIICSDLINLIIVLFIIGSISINLFIIIIIYSILLFISHILFKNNKTKIIKKIKRSEDIINNNLIEAISNVDTLKGSNLEKRFIDTFKLNYSSLLEKSYTYNLICEILVLIKNHLNDLLLVVIYAISSKLIINGNISISSIIIFISFLSMYSISLNKVIELYNNYHDFKISKERVEELFMINPENFINNFYYLKYNLDKDILIKNLKYKIGTKNIFNNLNLEIKSKEKIFIYGSSGTGKSTLVKMLLRYIKVDTNHIFINNIDINHYHLFNIRNNIKYNNEMLFTDTVRNNILLNKNIDDYEFNKICKLCLVDEIVHDNYDELIEENGFNLSNGERQRIVLARSIVSKSNIYIFDEATSGIDVLKEKLIMKNIFEYLKDSTIIFISHRNNNKKYFDRCLKLDKGILKDV